MKKIGLAFIFIFLTGLFSGLFFSTNLSADNNSYLSAILLSSFSKPELGFSHIFFTSILSNFMLIFLMLPALFTKYLCPLPPVLLWYKSFAIGFCSGLVYINAADDAFLISLLKIFPQNIFFIPAFIMLAAILFFFSLSQSFKSAALRNAGFSRDSSPYGRSRHKKTRPDMQSKLLLYGMAFSVILIILGSLTEATLHLIAP